MIRTLSFLLLFIAGLAQASTKTEIKSFLQSANENFSELELLIRSEELINALNKKIGSQEYQEEILLIESLGSAEGGKHSKAAYWLLAQLEMKCRAKLSQAGILSSAEEAQKRDFKRFAYGGALLGFLSSVAASKLPIYFRSFRFALTPLATWAGSQAGSAYNKGTKSFGSEPGILCPSEIYSFAPESRKEALDYAESPEKLATLYSEALTLAFYFGMSDLFEPQLRKSNHAAETALPKGCSQPFAQLSLVERLRNTAKKSMQKSWSLLHPKKVLPSLLIGFLIDESLRREILRQSEEHEARSRKDFEKAKKELLRIRTEDKSLRALATREAFLDAALDYHAKLAAKQMEALASNEPASKTQSQKEAFQELFLEYFAWRSGKATHVHRREDIAERILQACSNVETEDEGLFALYAIALSWRHGLFETKDLESRLGNTWRAIHSSESHTEEMLEVMP